MAKKKQPKKQPKITEQEDSGFGEYGESRGGGTPRGGYWGGKNGRVGWQKRADSGELPEGAHREEQPRTADGKFTYNSVNGRETKYEGRGETVNPLLTGGVNGIKIKDVEKQFREKSGALYEQYSKKWYERGSERIVRDKKGEYHTQKSKEDIWEVARHSFDIEKGEFAGESEVWESKKGRKSAAVHEAQDQAKKDKAAEAFVGEGEGIKKSLSADEEAKNAEEREIRSEAVDYLKGRHSAGRAPKEAFMKMEGGTPRKFTREELEGLIDTIKTTAARRIFSSAASRSTAPRAEAPERPERPDEPLPEVTADVSGANKEDKVYTYQKEAPKKEVKAGVKYGKDSVQKVHDFIMASEELSDEEKNGAVELLTEGTPEEIDDLLTQISSLGIIDL